VAAPGPHAAAPGEDTGGCGRPDELAQRQGVPLRQLPDAGARGPFHDPAEHALEQVRHLRGSERSQLDDLEQAVLGQRGDGVGGPLSRPHGDEQCDPAGHERQLVDQGGRRAVEQVRVLDDEEGALRPVDAFEEVADRRAEIPGVEVAGDAGQRAEGERTARLRAGDPDDLPVAPCVGHRTGDPGLAHARRPHDERAGAGHGAARPQHPVEL